MNEKELQDLRIRIGYHGKSQQFKYGFDLAVRELARKSKPENFNPIRLNFLADKIMDEQERFELETKHIFADFSKYLFSNRYKDATTFIGFMIWQLAINTQDFRSDAAICAVENKVSEQLKASAISADPFRLDGEEIINALLQVRESKIND